MVYSVGTEAGTSAAHKSDCGAGRCTCTMTDLDGDESLVDGLAQSGSGVAVEHTREKV